MAHVAFSNHLSHQEWDYILLQLARQEPLDLPFSLKSPTSHMQSNNSPLVQAPCAPLPVENRPETVLVNPFPHISINNVRHYLESDHYALALKCTFPPWRW